MAHLQLALAVGGGVDLDSVRRFREIVGRAFGDNALEAGIESIRLQLLIYVVDDVVERERALHLGQVDGHIGRNSAFGDGYLEAVAGAEPRQCVRDIGIADDSATRVTELRKRHLSRARSGRT